METRHFSDSSITTLEDTLEGYAEKALQMDKDDPLNHLRCQFSLPKDPHTIYLCNNSLGLPATSSSIKMQNLLKDWANAGAWGWFDEKINWYASYEFTLKKYLSNIIGAQFDEVIVMNSLTINLHLLLISFYRPTPTRFKILMDGPTFPSDLYAIKSQLSLHGFNPDESLIIIEPRQGEHLLRDEDIQNKLMEEGDSIALVFFNSVNFLSGQVLNMKGIANLAKQQEITIGFDIAHAAGNIPLKLHDWGIDFAVGCTYKYLCSGPGGPGIAYVHSRHHDQNFPRLSGWWGNDPKTRFRMHLEKNFIPHGGASSWQVSTPSILAMTPLLASLEIFDEAKMERLRQKSKLQTTFLIELLETLPPHLFTIITPKIAEFRGGQISLLLQEPGQACLHYLRSKGVICDFRPPNIIRVSPSPLYNTFYEIYQFVCRLQEALQGQL